MARRKLRNLVNHIVDADVVVVGGGLAGASAAIQARELGAKVVLVDKATVARSGVSLFAAGIFSVRFPEDDKNVWMDEMIRAGEYLNDQDWVDTLLEQIYPVAMQIHQWGEHYGLTIFERDDQGFVKRKSRGHIKTHHLVVNSLPMMNSLRRIAHFKGVKLVERVMAYSLVLKEGQVAGVIGLHTFSGELYLFRAKAVILSTGGCGFKSIYIGHRNLTGDAHAMAFRAGAHLKSMEQTSSNIVSRQYDIHGQNLFVGAGGRFLNGSGEEFMWRYQPLLGNRAGQPELVLSFSREVKEGRGPIYLDMTSVKAEDQLLMRKILPETFMLWDRAGVKPFEQRMEWTPAFRLKMGAGGGLNISTRCQTNLEGLYAAGDAACAPQHGTYTIGGMNLAFAAVSGVRAGSFACERSATAAKADLEGEAGQIEQLIADMLSPAERFSGHDPDALISKLQEVIIPMPVSYLRSRESLQDALERVSTIKAQDLPQVKAKEPQALVKALELRNMGLLAEAFLRSALLREESRGYHFREDFPLTNNRDWLLWVLAGATGKDDMTLWTEAVPTPFIRPLAEVQLPPGVVKSKATLQPC